MRRTALIAAVLAVFIGIIQLVARNGWVVALISAVIAFVVAYLVLRFAERRTRR